MNRFTLERLETSEFMRRQERRQYWYVLGICALVVFAVLYFGGSP